MSDFKLHENWKKKIYEIWITLLLKKTERETFLLVLQVCLLDTEIQSITNTMAV